MAGTSPSGFWASAHCIKFNEKKKKKSGRVGYPSGIRRVGLNGYPLKQTGRGSKRVFWGGSLNGAGQGGSKPDPLPSLLLRSERFQGCGSPWLVVSGVGRQQLVCNILGLKIKIWSLSHNMHSHNMHLHNLYYSLHNPDHGHINLMDRITEII